METEGESWHGMLLSVLRQRSPQVEGWALEEGKVPHSAKGPPPPFCSRFFCRVLSCELSSLLRTVHIKQTFLFGWRWGGSGDSCQCMSDTHLCNTRKLTNKNRTAKIAPKETKLQLLPPYWDQMASCSCQRTSQSNNRRLRSTGTVLSC